MPLLIVTIMIHLSIMIKIDNPTAWKKFFTILPNQRQTQHLVSGEILSELNLLEKFMITVYSFFLMSLDKNQGPVL